MTMASFPGGFAVPFGIGQHQLASTSPSLANTTIDAANEAFMYIGQVVTSDGASHTIDTTGSSAIQWRTDTSTFANAGTTGVVGLAAVDVTNGPPARAVNVTDVITFDVSRSMTGGGGGITSNAWQTHVPTSGTKTIANGDFVALGIQLTARAGADSIVIRANQGAGSAFHRPTATSFTGAAYAAVSAAPNAIIIFSDGAIGWFYATDLISVLTTRTWNSGSATKEYGQLYDLPVPVRISGLYGWIDPDADCDIVLYLDPLGTPVAEKTISLDLNAVAAASPRKFAVLFPAAYDLAANTPIAAVYKPGASNVSAYLKTLNDAAHRVTDVGGTSSYGISRASGAFANANSSLDHYYIGLLLSGAEIGGGGGGAPGHANMSGGLLS